MRPAFAVVLCSVLGACATFGGGEPDIYGIYDLVPGADEVTGWFELKTDGTWDMEISRPGWPEPGRFAGVFSIGEEKDGCLWIEVWVPDVPDAAGREFAITLGKRTPISICDGVMTDTNDENATFHKRRKPKTTKLSP